MQLVMVRWQQSFATRVSSITPWQRHVYCFMTPFTQGRTSRSRSAAVLLCVRTFSGLESSLWLSFNDNDAAGGSLNKGTSGTEDMAILVGRFWMTFTKLQCGFYSWRVHTKNKIADGPTRNSWESVDKLNSTFRRPRFPAWVRTFWTPLGLRKISLRQRRFEHDEQLH